MDWNAITPMVFVPAITGGATGAFFSWIFQRKLQKRQMQASLRQSAIQDLKAWTSKAYELYMVNEATWLGENRPPRATATSTQSEYMSLRDIADLAINTTFDKDQYTDFKDFADRLEKSLVESFMHGTPLGFEDFYAQREQLVKRLLERLWK